MKRDKLQLGVVDLGEEVLILAEGSFVPRNIKLPIPFQFLMKR